MLFLDPAAVAAAKTLKERQELIKRGLATPFSFQSATTKKSSKSLKLDDTFDSFLQTSNNSKSSAKSSRKQKDRKRSPSVEKNAVPKVSKLASNTDKDYVPSSSSSEDEVHGK